MGEGLGLVLLSSIGSYGALQVLIFSTLYFMIKEKAWEIPSEAFTTSSIFKIFIGAFFKLSSIILLIQIASESPVLALASQPAYISFNGILAVVQHIRPLTEITATAFLLFFISAIGICFQFSVLPGLMAISWSLIRNFQHNLASSMQKNQIKYNSYSNIIATFAAAGYYAIKFVIPSEADVAEHCTGCMMQTFIFSAVAAYFVVFLPSSLLHRQPTEHILQLGYLAIFIGAFSVFVLNGFYIVYLIINQIILFLHRYQTQENLPLMNDSQSGLIMHICSQRDSRRLSLFLMINLLFMFVEAAYGYWCNSLGLISDSIHMCFDCTALAIGLYASYVSKLPPDSENPYGYVRYEVLSGYINAIFLIFVGMNIFIESIERIMEPPEIQTEMLILVSVLGLLVNMIGLFFFHDHEGDNSNLEGVFLHILADTLGSVGVIVSSIFVHNWQWYIADPICSLIISSLIFLSVGGLIKRSIQMLLEQDIDGKSKKIRSKIAAIEGVEAVEKVAYTNLTGDQHIAMVWIKAKIGANSIEITQACKEFLPSWNSVQVT
mmetsp:Transcript_18889/g.18886  ORF Transcript_18889/g.18886 Transcript_18889/m.18886 type:complete len:549 (+) Transcript_18889:34-1680(+)